MARPKGTPQGYKVPGSGIQKGYRYDKPMSEDHRNSISKSLEGREILWADKIKESYKDIDASSRNREAWKKRRQTYIIINIETGQKWTTTNLTAWCKKHKMSVSHLCRISRFHKGLPLAGSRYYRKKYDCYVRGTLQNNKRRNEDGWKPSKLDF